MLKFPYNQTNVTSVNVIEKSTFSAAIQSIVTDSSKNPIISKISNDDSTTSITGVDTTTSTNFYAVSKIVKDPIADKFYVTIMQGPADVTCGTRTFSSTNHRPVILRLDNTIKADTVSKSLGAINYNNVVVAD